MDLVHDALRVKWVEVQSDETMWVGSTRGGIFQLHVNVATKKVSKHRDLLQQHTSFNRSGMKTPRST